MDDFPGELVILDINSNAGYDLSQQGGQAKISEQQWRDYAKEIQDGLNHKCSRSDTTTPLTERLMDEFIGTGTNGAGCVLPGE
jgi:hypothetical protein